MKLSGISVIICTYNGSTRLSETMKHLAAQVVPTTIQWEILLIDNHSTDNTFAIFKQLKESYHSLNIRLFQELKKGKIHAINLGIRESAYDCMIICDDDCWLAPNYLEIAYTSLQADSTIGVINGYYKNIFDSSVPDWFASYETQFANSNWGDQRLDLTDTLGAIWGAGMVLNKKAYQKMQKSGFQNFLSGGQGTKRLAGEDTEICLALRLFGYKIIYNPQLSFKHFMPASRITWQKVREISKANGEASIFYTPYRYYYNRQVGKPNYNHKQWTKELLQNLRFFLNVRTWLSYIFNKKPGNWSVLRVDRQLSKIMALIKYRNEYEELYKKIELLTQKKSL